MLGGYRDEKLFRKVEKVTVKLAGIPSINGTPGEVDMARFILDYLAENKYFQEHPQYLITQVLEGDRLGRMNVLALVKREKRPSRETVIIRGHTGTVGVDDFGVLKSYAFKPRELESELRKVELPEEVRADLESGRWIFGRGVPALMALFVTRNRRFPAPTRMSKPVVLRDCLARIPQGGCCAATAGTVCRRLRLHPVLGFHAGAQWQLPLPGTRGRGSRTLRHPATVVQSSRRVGP